MLFDFLETGSTDWGTQYWREKRKTYQSWQNFTIDPRTSRPLANWVSLSPKPEFFILKFLILQENNLFGDLGGIFRKIIPDQLSHDATTGSALYIEAWRSSIIWQGVRNSSRSGKKTNDELISNVFSGHQSYDILKLMEDGRSNIMRASPCLGYHVIQWYTLKTTTSKDWTIWVSWTTGTRIFQRWRTF